MKPLANRNGEKIDFTWLIDHCGLIRTIQLGDLHLFRFSDGYLSTLRFDDLMKDRCLTKPFGNNNINYEDDYSLFDYKGIPLVTYNLHVRIGEFSMASSWFKNKLLMAKMIHLLTIWEEYDEYVRSR